MVYNALLYYIHHPAFWNLDVMAGFLATTLDTDDRNMNELAEGAPNQSRD